MLWSKAKDMDTQPLFETSVLGHKIQVFSNRVVLQTWLGLGRRIDIPLDKIATIETGGIFQPSVTIETTGGEQFVIPAFFRKKQALRRAIEQARASK